MKPFATVLEAGTSLTNKTGSWRIERPSYVNRLPPCNKACPAGENIQEWLSLVEQEKYEDAWREIVKHNPMPAIMGRVCYHPCENACNRVVVDNPVGINSVEQFLGDMAIREGWYFAPAAKSSGKKVLVIGAGPAGLSAAHHLAQLGHKVTIKESQKKAGGMMRYGIPQYRLARKVLDAEIKRIVKQGVDLQLGTKVSDLNVLMKEESFEAVFLSVGAGKARTTPFPTEKDTRVFDAVSVLRDMEGKDKPDLGKRVAVYGGGNAALDVARTAKRLGAKDVTIIYRRNREKMPAHDFEVEEALEEKIEINFLSTIKSYQGKKITLEKMALDKSGFPQPTGKTERMEADCVVLALGQGVDAELFDGVDALKMEKGIIPVDEQMMTAQEGVFAGGDMVSSFRNVTISIGHGKKAARCMDAWLRGQKGASSKKHDLASSDRLNTWYYEKAPRRNRKLADPAQRTDSFDEVIKGLSQTDALSEARRCLSCGNCFECDNCYGVCPDNAIKKLGKGKGFEINYDYCKGCGLCVAECPCGAMEMTPEEN
ncbi:MAG TPA: glutamate synthase [Rhodospirillaceae bacterium]|nr:glutamate synthase [Rhodospirillaceae bacterium]